MKNKTIVIVEDEHKIANVLKKYLEHAEFNVIVLEEGQKAVETIKKVDPILCILDLMLPDIDGLSICSSLREFSQIPIIILTQKDHEEDRLTGLNLGADDYICKPVGPREVVARVQTILRRAYSKKNIQDSERIEYKDIILLLEQFECYICGQKIELTPLEFKMLETFISHPKRVFPREKLMDLCYQNIRVVSNRTIDTHIKNLRKKLLSATGEQKIASIYGKGYKLV